MLPSAPAPPGVIASPCASCGATPPPAPKPLPRPWSPAELGDRREGRRMRKAGAAAPALQSGPLIPYGAGVLLSCPLMAILHLCLNRRSYTNKAAQPSACRFVDQMAAWTCSPQRAGPREIQNPPDAQGIDCDAHHRPRRCRRWVPRRMRLGAEAAGRANRAIKYTAFRKADRGRASCTFPMPVNPSTMAYCSPRGIRSQGADVDGGEGLRCQLRLRGEEAHEELPQTGPAETGPSHRPRTVRR